MGVGGVGGVPWSRFIRGVVISSISSPFLSLILQPEDGPHVGPKDVVVRTFIITIIEVR